MPRHSTPKPQTQRPYRVTISLAERESEQPRLLVLDDDTISLTLELATKAGNFLDSLFKRKRIPHESDIFRYHVTLMGDSGLTIAQGRHLITCEVTGGQAAAQGEFTTKDGHTLGDKICIPLRLYLQPSAIDDCVQELTADRTFLQPFRIVVTRQSSKRGSQPKDVFQIDQKVEVTIRRHIPRLRYSFEFLPECAKLTYGHQDQPQQVGYLTISHDAEFASAPPVADIGLDLAAKIEARDAAGQSLTPAVRQDRFFIIANDGIEIMTSKGIERKNEAQYTRTSDTRLHIGCLPGGHQIVVPVLWDMSAAANPLSDAPDLYTPRVRSDDDSDWQTCPDPDGHEARLSLVRNPIITKLSVSLTMPTATGTDRHDITLGEADLSLGKLTIQEGFQSYPRLTVANTATADDPAHPGASIIVWGIELSDIEQAPGTATISSRDNQELGSLIRLDIDAENGRRVEPRPVGRELRWRLTQSQSVEMNICISPDDIEAIRPAPEAEETVCRIEFTLTYYALPDPKGLYYHYADPNRTWPPEQLNAEDYRHQRRFSLQLHREPAAEWLCVDFGTSAVVAAYAQDSDGLRPLNLKAQKDFILAQTFSDRNEGPKRRNDDEAEPMIASTVCLNQNAPADRDCRTVSENFKDYRNHTLWFSPSSGMFDPDYGLPCLKSMMGYEYMPWIFDIQSLTSSFTYSDGQDTLHLARLDSNGQLHPTALMKMSEIFRIVYEQLFRLYLSQQMPGPGESKPRKRPIEKLILSVPNTYTPLDLHAIRSLARKVMPDIYPEHLCTVSESDAVACYYLARRADFHQYYLKHAADNGQDGADNRITRLVEDERVLVFDMGAGTLDLTYFHCRQREGKTEVSILGRMGTSRAGNYLDYELARSLVNWAKAEVNGVRIIPANESDVERLANLLETDQAIATQKMVSAQDRLALKNYVKRLKAQADNPMQDLDDLTLPSSGATFAFHVMKVADIFGDEMVIGDEEFIQCVESIIADSLKQFAALFSDRADQLLPIDTFIFSGRSTCLRNIRAAVEHCVHDFCAVNDDFPLLYADLCNTTLLSHPYSAAPSGQQAQDGTALLKTVVISGALDYARLVRRDDADYRITERSLYATIGLVIHRGRADYEWMPLIGNKASQQTEDDNALRYEGEIDGHGITQIDLVQSYSTDVVHDYRLKQFHSIARLMTIRRERWDAHLRVKLTMHKDCPVYSDQVLEFSLGAQSVTLSPHNDWNDESLRHSLWPAVFTAFN